jgi:hypothetical protein
MRQVLQIAIVLGFFRRRRRIDFGFGAAAYLRLPILPVGPR